MNRVVKLCLTGCILGFSSGAGAASWPVRVAVVHFAPAAEARAFSGSVQPRTRADLGLQVGGKVISRPVEIGERVRAGQVLARLDPADLVLGQQVAASAVASAEAEAANARADLARYEHLGAGSAAYLPSEYDKRLAAARMADARLQQAAHQLALARDQLSYGTLTADADGVITALPVQVGQVVSVGQTVATLAHSGEVEIAVDVPENLVGGLRVGQVASARLWTAPDHPLQARVREIGALADATTRTFAVRFSLVDPPPGLVAFGMTATVRLDADAARVAILPASALCDRAGAPAMWVLNPGAQHAGLRRVDVAGYRADGTVLVSGGLAEGEQVITAGTSQIEPDMTLTAWQGPSR
jgi:RND family efflux transporter MFP subunit